MSDEPTTGETRAERIKRTWNEGEPERAARRAEGEAARRAEREAVGLIRRTGHRVAGPGRRLLLALTVLAVLVLPSVAVWAFVDSDAWLTVAGVTFGICLCLAVCWFCAGTDCSGDW